jgi:6-phosphogluconolactonase
MPSFLHHTSVAAVRLLFWLASAAAASVVTPGTAAEYRVYIGTYTTDGSSSRGIYVCEFDTETGRLTSPRLAAEQVNPSFLAVHPDATALYCVNEVTEGEGRGNGYVTAFRVLPDGALEKINQQASLGGLPCHCNLDSAGRSLLVANYTGGNVVVLPVSEDHSLQPVSCNMQHEGQSIDARQQAPHAHSINLSADNRFAYAADLGTDKVVIYRFDAKSGQLSPAVPPFVSVRPGGGPRHFSIHPSGNFAFTNNEITLVVTAFRRDPENGALLPIQDISTVPGRPEPSMSTAECLVHPNGQFLYVSNRGHETIAVFTIEQKTGLLTRVENQETGGREPRNFVIDPAGRWLLAENQNTDSIRVFQIDQQTGALSPTEHGANVGRPVCIRMIPVRQ